MKPSLVVGKEWAGRILTYYHLVFTIPTACVASPISADWTRHYGLSRHVPITNGITKVDLDGDGQLDSVISAWYDAHDAIIKTVTTFYRHVRSGGPEPKGSTVIPFLNVHDKNIWGDPVLYATFGPEEVLRSYRLYSGKQKGLNVIHIIVGNKINALPFGVPSPIEFTMFEGRHPDPTDTNWVHSYGFYEVASFRTIEAFRDVTEGFAAEFGK